MRNELQQRLVDRWPTWFSIGGDPRYTSMHFGFQHGDGWFDLLWRLCERLEPVVVAAEKETGRGFEVLQVKEKFGGLRFYGNYQNDVISTLIEVSQFESLHICEVCGQPGQPRLGNWIQTLCNDHARTHTPAHTQVSDALPLQGAIFRCISVRADIRAVLPPELSSDRQQE
jgi:hypothetical protein